MWTSPDGCLMFTASRRLKVPGSQAPFINYLVCLAVVRGIADACAPWLKVRCRLDRRNMHDGLMIAKRKGVGKCSWRVGIC